MRKIKVQGAITPGDIRFLAFFFVMFLLLMWIKFGALEAFAWSGLIVCNFVQIDRRWAKEELERGDKQGESENVNG